MSLVFATTFFFFLIWGGGGGGGGGVLRHSAVQTDFEFEISGPLLKVFCQKHAYGIANSEDPDQTAPLGAV